MILFKRRGAIAVFTLVFLSIGCGDKTTGPADSTPPPAPPPIPPPTTANPDSNLVGRIVYTLLGGLHVYTVSTKRVVFLGVNGINPKFSPDGSQIVFQNTPGVKIMNSDGTNVRILDSNSGGVPAFDHTGQMVAFGNRNTGVWKVRVDGTGLTQLTTDGGFQPAWSPDGSRIAYSVTVGSTQQLFIVDADGSNRRQALVSKAVVDIVWRPSTKILFGMLIEDLNYEIHSYDPGDATSLMRLTTLASNDFEPSWSPDGKNISWSNITNGLWIMNADGSGQRLVIENARQGSWGR